MMVTMNEPRRSGLISNVGLTRAVAIGILMIAALAIQSTLLPLATLLGVIPQLVLVVIVSLAYVDGERVGIVTGFVGGLLMDLLIPGAPVGVNALLFVLIGYGVARFRQLSPSESVWTPVVVVIFASAIAEFGYGLLQIMFGQPWIALADTAKVAGLVIVYNTLLTPFVYPLVRRVSQRFGPQGFM
jgi:rod shape-determining protein MreD